MLVRHPRGDVKQRVVQEIKIWVSLDCTNKVIETMVKKGDHLGREYEVIRERGLILEGFQY